MIPILFSLYLGGVYTKQRYIYLLMAVYSCSMTLPIK